jgi:hypothetical protein
MVIWIVTRGSDSQVAEANSKKEQDDSSVLGFSFVMILGILLLLLFGAVMISFYITYVSSEKGGTYAQLLGAVATIILSLVTVVTLFENLRLTQQPQVETTLEQDEMAPNMVYLVIQNHGRGAAYDLTFKITSSAGYIGGVRLDDVGFIKNGIKYMSPGQRYKGLAANTVQSGDEILKKEFAFQITYKDLRKKTYSRTFSYSFATIMGP